MNQCQVSVLIMYVYCSDTPEIPGKSPWSVFGRALADCPLMSASSLRRSSVHCVLTGLLTWVAWGDMYWASTRPPLGHVPCVQRDTRGWTFSGATWTGSTMGLNIHLRLTILVHLLPVWTDPINSLWTGCIIICFQVCCDLLLGATRLVFFDHISNSLVGLLVLYAYSICVFLFSWTLSCIHNWAFLCSMWSSWCSSLVFWIPSNILMQIIGLWAFLKPLVLSKPMLSSVLARSTSKLVSFRWDANRQLMGGTCVVYALGHFAKNLIGRGTSSISI